MIKGGVTNPDPKQTFLTDLGQYTNNWRGKDEKREIVLMTDLNTYIRDKGALYDFYVEYDLMDYVAILNPDIELDPTYLYGHKRVDYLFTIPTLFELDNEGGVSPIPSAHNT